MLYGLLYEIFFDDKEEYDIRSHKFKFTRVLGVLVFSLSIATNFWLYKEYYKQTRLKLAQCGEKTTTTTATKDKPLPKLSVDAEHDDTGYSDPDEESSTGTSQFKSIDELMEEERRKRNTGE